MKSDFFSFYSNTVNITIAVMMITKENNGKCVMSQCNKS